MRHHRFLVTAFCAMLCVVHGAYLVAPPMSRGASVGQF